MTVVAVRGKFLDLGESMLNEDGEMGDVKGVVTVTGAGVFDENERLLPLISSFLSEKLDTKKFALQTALTYGRNLGYCQDFLNGRRELSAWESDEKFLHVGQPILRAYVSQMQSLELGSKTVRNRDASIQSFISRFLCITRDDRPAFRADDPYASGLISPAPKSTLVKSCSLPDLRVLIESTSLERERCLLQFIFDSGVRRSEVPRVMRASIDEALRLGQAVSSADPRTIDTPSNYCLLHINGSKGGGDQIKERLSIVSPATLERIKRYHASAIYKRHSRKFPKDQAPAFLNAHGHPYTPNSISALLSRVSKRAIRNLKLAKPISPHKLRHGYAYALLNSKDLGNDLLERQVMLQKALGHSKPSTTEMYTRVPANLLNAICGTNQDAESKAMEMEALSIDTRLAIDARAKK
jgi:integrase/recombinase XerC